MCCLLFVVVVVCYENLFIAHVNYLLIVDMFVRFVVFLLFPLVVFLFNSRVVVLIVVCRLMYPDCCVLIVWGCHWVLCDV